MKSLFSKPWFLVLLGFALLAGAAWLLTRSPDPGPPLSPGQVAATQKGINNDQQQVGADTTRAKAAAASAAPNYQAGSAYAELGKVLHQQSKPHAKPAAVASDTAAARLQRELSSY